VDSSIAFGNTSELDTIHSTGAGAMNWSNYIYTGKLSITEANGGTGVTFFSRYSDLTATGNREDLFSAAPVTRQQMVQQWIHL
jgi:hypothetical protein